MLDAALRYAARGWRVFPVHSWQDGRCSCGYQCASPAKHPRTDNGLKDASADPSQIAWWWTKWPDANIAIATGDGLAVVDVDEKSGGYESLTEFHFPDTPIVMTGGGGLHYYFAGAARTGVGRRRGIDVRGEGGYVVAPPSNHESGRTYEWDIATEDLPLAPFPEELATGPALRVVDGAPDEAIGSGARNATLASLAGSMRRRGMSRDAILAALHAENQARCVPPLADREVEIIASSVARYAPEPSAEVEVLARPMPEFLADRTPRPRFIVDSVIPENSIILCIGHPKSFKSFLMSELGHAVSTGTRFLDHFYVPAPQTVLLIDHESSRGALTERMRRAAMRYGDTRSLYVISNKAFSLEDPVDVDRLRLEIRAVRPALTILDPLASFIRGDENSAQQMGVVIRTLRQLRDELGTSFVIVHHLNKSGGIRGSSVFFGAADGLIKVERVDADIPRSTVRVQLKDGDAPPHFQVSFEAEGSELRYIDPLADSLSRMTALSKWVPPVVEATPEQIPAPYYSQD